MTVAIALAEMARRLVDELDAGKPVRAELEAVLAELADEIDRENEHGAGTEDAGDVRPAFEGAS